MRLIETLITLIAILKLIVYFECKFASEKQYFLPCLSPDNKLGAISRIWIRREGKNAN